jgi:hypothetical protein
MRQKRTVRTVPNFSADNTPGYDAAGLAALNAAWDELAAAARNSQPPLDLEAYGDYWSERLLLKYDRGARGAGLLAWFYQRAGLPGRT